MKKIKRIWGELFETKFVDDVYDEPDEKYPPIMDMVAMSIILGGMFLIFIGIAIQAIEAVMNITMFQIVFILIALGLVFWAYKRISNR